MVQNIRLQFKLILSQVSWMDDLSRNAAQEKVHSDIVFFIFFAVYIEANLLVHFKGGSNECQNRLS
jgi:hypothetical protein